MVLDNIDEIKKLDGQNMLGSIYKLSDQIEQIAKEAGKLKLPAGYKKVKNIVYAGMGGSALGAHCIRSVFAGNIKIPFEIVNDYSLPATVNKNTLVITTSYSGDTEETLSALESARKKGAKIFVITSGGKLAEAARQKKISALVFGTQNNPCGSPRMGLGYTIFGPLLVLAKLGIVKNVQTKKIVEEVHLATERLSVEVGSITNPAKIIAQKMEGATVWYVGARHLAGNAHVAANQLNENAKRFAGYFLIPELNHHLMEGLAHPESNKKLFILLESPLYDEKIQKRFNVTKEVLQKNGAEFAVYRCEGKDNLSDSVEALVFGSFLSFYDAMLEGIDPTAIPYVDYFKEALKK